jgi:hypothetical protein
LRTAARCKTTRKQPTPLADRSPREFTNILQELAIPQPILIGMAEPENRIKTTALPLPAVSELAGATSRSHRASAYTTLRIILSKCRAGRLGKSASINPFKIKK